MEQEPLEFTLRDGAVVLVRPVVPEDGERLQRGFEHLSDRSRYQRFHGAQPRLTPDLVSYFTEVDQHDHLAWGALARDEPGRPGVGVARAIRLEQEPTVAESAVTVLDDYQGLGLGTLLLGMLARRAQEVGIERFRNYVLGENRPMLRLFRDLGADPVEHERGEYRIDLAVPCDGDGLLPDTPAARIFQAVAYGELPPLSSAAPPVWDLEAAAH